jgi:septum formation protein
VHRDREERESYHPARPPLQCHLVPTLPLVLASASPRRRELLARLGLAFEVAPADVDETHLANEAPRDYAARLAEAKARAAGARAGAARIIGADTIVVLDGQVLGKPADARQASDYLRRLRGRAHVVVTAVAVLDTATGRIERGVDETTVWMRAFTDAEMDTYIASGDPLDKAGAYALQHADFHPVRQIAGSETNVIGLPLELLSALLARSGERASP